MCVIFFFNTIMSFDGDEASRHIFIFKREGKYKKHWYTIVVKK